MADVLRLMMLLVTLTMIVVGVAAALTVVAVRRVVGAVRSRYGGVLGWVARDLDRVPTRRLAGMGGSDAWLLPLRTFLPGPTRPIAALRWELTRDVQSAARAVEAGVAAGRPVEQLRRPAAGVLAVASDLDLDLAVISREPDHEIRRALLTERANRIDALRRACAQLRHGVLLAGGPPSATLPRYVLDELDEQVERLRLAADAYQHLAAHGRD